MQLQLHLAALGLDAAGKERKINKGARSEVRGGGRGAGLRGRSGPPGTPPLDARTAGAAWTSALPRALQPCLQLRETGAVAWLLTLHSRTSLQRMVPGYAFSAAAPPPAGRTLKASSCCPMCARSFSRQPAFTTM